MSAYIQEYDTPYGSQPYYQHGYPRVKHESQVPLYSAYPPTQIPSSPTLPKRSVLSKLRGVTRNLWLYEMIASLMAMIFLGLIGLVCKLWDGSTVAKHPNGPIVYLNLLIP
jgi:hypothetical protein